jgi:hypothetical protein
VPPRQLAAILLLHCTALCLALHCPALHCASRCPALHCASRITATALHCASRCTALHYTVPHAALHSTVPDSALHCNVPNTAPHCSAHWTSEFKEAAIKQTRLKPIYFVNKNMSKRCYYKVKSLAHTLPLKNVKHPKVFLAPKTVSKQDFRS